MAIGDDLQILLGLVPTRDRAGIQRGTMATEAARADGNAEGQTLTRQGFAPTVLPPQISLPPAMGQPRLPAIDPQMAAKMQTMDAGSTGTSAAPTPVPRERVVAASPAAAPSPGVTRHSDIILQAMEEEKRKAKMQQLFSGLGLLANGLFNRNPDSASATRQSLLAGAGGGLSGGGGGTDLGTLKTLLDMRSKEDETIRARANEENAIDTLMRLHGWDYYRAKAHVDSGKAGEGLTKEVTDRAAARQSETLKSRLLEDVPRYAKILGEDENSVRARIINDPNEFTKSLSPKVISDVEKDRAATGETILKTKITQQDRNEWEADRSAPDKFAEEHGITRDEAIRYLKTPESRQEFLKQSQPTSRELGATYRDYLRLRRQGNKPPEEDMTIEQWKAVGPKQVESPEDKIRAEQNRMVAEVINKRLIEEQTQSRKTVDSININKMQQDKWREEGLITGGWGADAQLKLRQTIARMYGIPDEEADNTQAFMMLAKERIRAKAKSLPGPLSEKELAFLEEGTGGPTTSKEAHRMMAVIQEKIDRSEMIERNKYVDEQMANPDMRGIAKHYKKVPLPEPGRFLREAVEENKPLVMDLRADPSPENKAQYDNQYGPGMADYVISKPKSWVDKLKD